MNKLTKVLALTLSVCALSSTAIAGTISINNTTIKSSTAPIVDKGTTLVPLRLISENLGASVNFNNGTIVINKNNDTISLKLGSLDAVVNDSSVKLARPALLKNNVTYVPIRFIAEAFGCSVDYKNGNVYICEPGVTHEIPETTNGQEELTTVYWVSGGKCYHSTKDCPTLGRSKNIKSGTIAESHKDEPCNICIHNN